MSKEIKQMHREMREKIHPDDFICLKKSDAKWFSWTFFMMGLFVGWEGFLFVILIGSI